VVLDNDVLSVFCVIGVDVFSIFDALSVFDVFSVEISGALLSVKDNLHGLQNGLVGVGRRYDGSNVGVTGVVVGVIVGKNGSGVKSGGVMETGIHEEETLL
jgi:hypothetical protein